MFNTSLNKRKNSADLIQLVISYIIVFLLSLAFVVSDWMYNYFTFSEYILILVLALLLLTLNFRVTTEQFKLIFFTTLLLLVHVVFQQLFNDDFILRTAFFGVIKFLFYLITISAVVNYIRVKDLENSFLLVNNYMALFIIILGVYITYALYQESSIPREIFWQFTRRDIYSYYFESNPAIIRTRSIFSEPAHLGFYLNTLLVANLFSIVRSKLRIFFIIILSLGILLTFSYSMIAILGVTFLLKGIYLFLKGDLRWSNWYIIVPVVIFILTIYNWEIINTTLIQRTLAVITGQDTSARMRLFDSWQYINKNNFLLGNGIGHTPIVTSVYAYALSDFGLVGFAIMIILTIKILFKNWPIGVVFIFLNSAKGGYLSSSFWLMIMILVLYGFINRAPRKK